MDQTRGAERILSTERILSKLVAWAAGREDLRAIAVVGSHARSDHPADPWSDLDVVVMARRPGRYLGDTRWIEEIECPWLAVQVPTVVGGQQIFHIAFEGGTKVDLVLVSSRAFSLAARVLGALRRHPRLLVLLPRIARDRLAMLSNLLNRGFRFALDKDRLEDRLGSGGPALPVPGPPSEQAFLDLVKLFLNEQVSMALKLRRGEFFVAKTLGEARLTDLLLQMLEWHARATSDRWSPVFERGRYLEEWAPPPVIEQLPKIFPHYDPSEIWRARFEALDLFRRLAEETGAALGYAYPRELEATVMAWVRDQAAGSSSSA